MIIRSVPAMIPPNAIIEVKLLDVSRADAPAVTIAEQRITSAGKQVPFTFELRYNPGQINDRGRYVVRAVCTHSTSADNAA